MSYTRAYQGEDILSCSRCGTSIIGTMEVVEALSRTEILIECPKGNLHAFSKHEPLFMV